MCLKRGSLWRGAKKRKFAYSDRHMYEKNAYAMGLASCSLWMFGAKFLLKSMATPFVEMQRHFGELVGLIVFQSPGNSKFPFVFHLGRVCSSCMVVITILDL